MSIAENVEKIRNSIPDDVLLVAAVKYASNEQILELAKAGVKDLGFNTYQQLEAVREELPPYARIHFIGHLQRNKVRKLLRLGIYLIQSVDSYKLAEKINEVIAELGIKQDILLQIKTDESKKYGFDPKEMKKIVLEVNNNLKNISIKGLMTIPPLSENPSDSRKYFSLTKGFFDGLSGKIGNMEYLSMGMSNDYKVAIEEGANMVRIGRALFHKVQ